MPFVTTPERIALEDARRAGLIEGIQELLKDKFGDDGLHLMAEIQTIPEEDKLKAVLRAIGKATALEEVRRSWKN